MSATPNLHDRTRRVIRADGRVEPLAGPVTMAEAEKLIGAQVLDYVTLRHLGEPFMVMLVNDRQYETEEIKRVVHWQGFKVEQTELRPTRALYPVNALATVLYLANCQPGTTHQILGDVVVVPDSDFGRLV